VAWSGTADTVTSDIISAWGAEGTNPTLIANATYENTPANLNVTTSWATYSVTANVDTASTANIIVFIWSDVTDTTLGDFLYITNAQLEVGTSATPFERRMYGQELALCQRYYYRITAGSSFGQFGFATSRGTTNQEGSFPVPVTMRDTPSALDYSALLMALYAGGSSSAVSSATLNSNSNNKQVPNVTFTTSGSLGAAGACVQVLANNNTSAYIGFGAEL
jgi:hypothetical protein